MAYGSPGEAPAGGNDTGLPGGQGGRGGGVYSGGTLTLDHVVVTGNQSGIGGPGVAGTTGNASADYFDRYPELSRDSLQRVINQSNYFHAK